jgi:hypothetical protein
MYKVSLGPLFEAVFWRKRQFRINKLDYSDGGRQLSKHVHSAHCDYIGNKNVFF